MTEAVGSDSLQRDVGQMLVVGFDGASEAPPPPVADALRRGTIGGVVLFGRNIESPEQLVALNRRIHELAAEAGPPPLVAVDQEGGSVARLRDGFTSIPPMRDVGEVGDPEYIAGVSEVIARELRTVGFNLNFAPVLDVDTNPDNPIIGDRAFGDDPEGVARAAGAFLFGHHSAGVLPCGKHFPGHGDTDRDSHLELPVVSHDLDRLRNVELVPFRRAVGAGIPMLMTAHISLPVLDAVRPATFSPAVVEDLLRDELAFDGVVATDDLEMDAVADQWSIGEMIDMGLAATIDIFLICHTHARWRSAFERLVERGRDQEAAAARIRRSAERIRQLKSEFLGHQPQPWTPDDDWSEHLDTPAHRRRVDPDTGPADPNRGS